MPNQEIRSQEDLFNQVLGSSQKLEIGNLQQMENLLEMNVQPDVWEDASNRNLLSFNQEFAQGTTKFVFFSRGIKHIYLISFFTNLIDLDLSNNNISDISSIAKLKNLKKLDLNSNSIEDISALQSIHDLTHLYLSCNKFTSYTLALPNLVELLLGYNSLKNKSGLQHSPKLERLYLSGTETIDLRSIPHQLFGLKVLQLSQNKITQISHLSNFLNLQRLNLDYNYWLQNIQPIKFCTQLTELRIFTTSISDIWPLQFLKNLKTLIIAKTQVVDLHPLQYLYQLESIYAYDACIIDVSPLSKLTQLKDLDFRKNKITNAETLKHHKNISEYDFSNQQVPTTDELKLYSKILSVHSSQKQIKKIQAENRTSKFKESMTHLQKQINYKINEQTRSMNKKIEIWVQFIQNSKADQ
ncbi:leucine-rich_repeat domain-containing protein [Hexamita inflata]|uniref:Leucine-rich repeat domain-containing protein n=1 Tax=Hexamita inflata TaxID=28002 RepID=A0AA86U7H0_9EUKA|nr:leucine-rich repeat domain-containing protein [Hexamita inflata]